MEGLEKFREAFESYSDNYVIIGGTACDITMTGTVVRPRATHDIDMIVIVEKMTSDFAERCLAFLKKALADSRASKKIVVTHHVPSFQMQCPKFADSQANGAFTVELEDYIKNSGINYWIYGHSHYNVDVEIGNTRCVSNQLGYVFHGEQRSFNPCKYIEL